MLVAIVAGKAMYEDLPSTNCESNDLEFVTTKPAPKPQIT